VLAVLAAPGQLYSRLVKSAIGTASDKIEDRLTTFDYLNVGALTEDHLENFVLLEPLAHEFSREVTSFRNLIVIFVLKLRYPLTILSFSVVGGELLGLENAVNHVSDVLEAFNSPFEVGRFEEAESDLQLSLLNYFIPVGCDRSKHEDPVKIVDNLVDLILAADFHVLLRQSA
jgi:hypothetical protein